MTKIYIQGGSPYDFSLLEHELISSGLLLGARVPPVLPIAPPWILSFFAIFFGYSYLSSVFLYNFVALAVIVFSVYLLKKSILFNLSKLSELLLLLTFFPLLKTIYIGQLSFFLLLGIVVILYAIKNNYPFLAGLSFWALSFKPHIGIGITLTCLLYFREKKDWWRFLSGGFLALIVLYLLNINNTSLVYEYWKSLSFSIPVAKDYDQPTLRALLHQSFNIDISFILLTCSLAIFGAYIGWHRKYTFDNSIQYLLPMTCILSPYAWAHDYIILLPTVFWGLLKTSNKQFYIFSTIFISVLLSLIFILSKTESLTIILSFFFLWLFYKDTTSDPQGISH